MENYLLLLPIIISVLGAITSLFVFRNNEKRNHIYIFFVVLLTSIVTWILLFTIKEGEKFIIIQFFEGLDISLKLDGLGKIFSGMVSILWPLAMLYAFSYMKHAAKRNIYFMFYTMTYGIVLGISFSANMETLYLFYECLTLATLPLIIQPMTKQSKKAGRIYMYFSLAGSAMAFMGLMFLLKFTKGTDLSTDFILGGNAYLKEGPESVLRVAYFVAFMGFGVKSAIFPLHIWLPLAGAAPTPTTALLHAVAVVKSGVFALMRLTYFAFPMELIRGEWVQTVTMCLAIFTILYGSIRALKETHFKRRLAYSTISNLSYIIFAITLMSRVGLQAAVIHMLFHSISKITLFYSCGIVMHKAEVNYIYELDGLGKKMPIAFICFFVSAMSLTGIPLFAGFISKYYLVDAAISANSILAFVGIVALIISALLTAIYSLNICFRAFINKPSEVNAHAYELAHDGDIKFNIPIIVFSALCVVFGFFSSGLINVVSSLIGM